MQVKRYLFLLFILANARPALSQCQVSLSQQHVNYGSIQRTYQRIDALPERTVELVAFCNTPEEIAIFVQGDLGVGGFRFKNNNGRVLLSVSNATVEGQHVRLARTRGHSSFLIGSTPRRELIIFSGAGFVPVNEKGDIISGRSLTATLTIKPEIKEGDIRMTEPESIISNIHFSVETE